MALTRDEIAHVASLARLEFNEEELLRLMSQLTGILDYVAKLNELETHEVPPTSHVLPLEDIYRGDEPRPSLPREEILKNAPDTAAGCFRVPKVIEA